MTAAPETDAVLMAAVERLERFEYNGWRPFTFTSSTPDDRGYLESASAIVTLLARSLRQQDILDGHFYAKALEGVERLMALDALGAVAHARKGEQ